MQPQARQPTRPIIIPGKAMGLVTSLHQIYTAMHTNHVSATSNSNSPPSISVGLSGDLRKRLCC